MGVVKRPKNGPLDEVYTRMSESMGALADAFMQTVNAGVRDSAADCPAQQDRACSDFDDESGWGRPLLGYADRALVWSLSVQDHMLALAALIASERVLQAPVTVTRTALEGLSLIHWLYEPGISRAEKVRRHVNLRLAGAADELNEWEGAGGAKSAYPRPAQADQTVESVRKSAHLIDGRLRAARSRGSYWEPARIGDSVPSRMKRIREMGLVSLKGAPNAGDYVYRQMSAVAHAGELTLYQFMTQTTDAGDGLMRIVVGTTAADLAIRTGPLLVALGKVMDRLAAYYGLSLDAWHAQWSHTATLWAEQFSPAQQS